MRRPSSKTVVVLGKGYIGTALEAEFSYAHRPHYAISRERMDYHNVVGVRSMLRKLNPDAVVLAFGFTGSPNVDACESEPDKTYDYNCHIPAMIAKECANHKTHCIALSTGCIFDGYDKVFSHDDEPNNGVSSATSSVYCKSKHEFEKAVKDLPVSVIRLRMPYDQRPSPRNYLMKLLQYPNILNKLNSKTFVPDLVRLVGRLADKENVEHGIYHAVNPAPLEMAEILSVCLDRDLYRKDWALVDRVDTVATRSNCVLKNNISRRLSYFLTERTCLDYSLKLLRKHIVHQQKSNQVRDEK